MYHCKKLNKLWHDNLKINAKICNKKLIDIIYDHKESLREIGWAFKKKKQTNKQRPIKITLASSNHYLRKCTFKWNEQQ